MTIFYSDVEPTSQFSPVTLHLSPATRILNENPDGKVNIYICVCELFIYQKTVKVQHRLL